MKSGFQIFVENTVLSLLSIVKVLLLSKFNLKLPKDSKKHDECVILGNGPSLKDSIEEHLSFLEEKALCCVNYFSRTSYFTQLKPEYYIITSPEYWKGEEKEAWKTDRMKTFEEIATKTDWEMHMIVPAMARSQTEWKKTIGQNPKIKISYFNNTPVEGFSYLKHFFFKTNLGMPRPHNVLVGSLFIAINLNFKKIYIAGADHNWTKELEVNEENEVLINQKHFYDKETEKEKIDKNKPGAKPMYVGGSIQKRKIHEVLMKFVHSFKSYWELKEYARGKGVKIFNITPGSFIDAFDRLRIKSTKDGE